MEKGTKIRVTFELELPTAADDPEVLEWLNFELGGQSCWLNNPMGLRSVSRPFRASLAQRGEANAHTRSC